MNSFELTQAQSDRLVEIAYYEIYKQSKFKIPNEKFFMFLENFCRTFSIDYTSVVITNTQFLKKIAPTKQELVLFGIITGTKLKTLGMDYRTIREYKKRIHQGRAALVPRILNRFIRDDLRKFVVSFFNLFPDNSEYLYHFAKDGGFLVAEEV